MTEHLHENPEQYFIDYNFMTPDVIKYGFTDKFAYELSEGKGFLSDDKIYGVTFADIKTGACSDKSQSFNSLKEANEYIGDH